MRGNNGIGLLGDGGGRMDGNKICPDESSSFSVRERDVSHELCMLERMAGRRVGGDEVGRGRREREESGAGVESEVEVEVDI
jgi:hypothetical protein